MSKQGLCLDFDGVLHLYASPWVDEHTVVDGPAPGAFAFLTEAVAHFRVHVFSTRSKTLAGVEAMIAWFTRHGLPPEVLAQLHFPSMKPMAVLYIDDRAWRFEGGWPTVAEIKAFRPWNKRGDAPLSPGEIQVTPLTLAAEVLALRETLDGLCVSDDVDSCAAYIDLRTGLATLHYHLTLLAARTCGTHGQLP